MGDDEYTVELTEGAEQTYLKFVAEADGSIARGDRSNARVKRLRLVDGAINRIIPADPFNPRRALGHPLSNIFRVKKGRLRICYVGSSELRRIVILYISESPRKAKDVHDPYAIFARLVKAGSFDEVFTELGVRRQPMAERAPPVA